MPPPGFKLTIPVSKRSQIYALDHVAIGMGGYFHKKVTSEGKIVYKQHLCVLQYYKTVLGQ